MRRLLLLLLTCCFVLSTAVAQTKASLTIAVVNSNQRPVSHATVELLEKDSSLVKVALSDSTGTVHFAHIRATPYLLLVHSVGYAASLQLIDASQKQSFSVQLVAQNSMLSDVTISTRKRFIELHPDKTVVNIEAGIANVGTTVLEALEKLPGVTVDDAGNISYKGRTGVLVMLNGKPTYLTGSELATFLSGLSSNDISQVELMDNPPAKYDAAGNAGIINIKTKKNTQRGFNGIVNTSYGQGFYPKSNNNLSLNFRSGRWNAFASYGVSYNGYFTRIYALRTYFEADGKTVASLLEQPSFLSGNFLAHTLRTGVDYELSKRSLVSLTLSGNHFHRHGSSNNSAYWKRPAGHIDSLIFTTSTNSTNWKHAGGSFHFRHNFTANRELTADVDVLNYAIKNQQFFENRSILPGTYVEASNANIPTGITIFSTKTDYAEQLKSVKIEAGWKMSNISTDNDAVYYFRDAGSWRNDWGRSNHFLYKENIHAFYGTAQTKIRKWSLQGGLRFEATAYDAHQLGNALVKDSSFSRTYNSLFPSVFVSYEKDSAHTFSFRSSRRIDRPPFQKLNPFLFIINKYTFQRGNPYYRPQYTLNFEVSHLYKNLLITGISYSCTDDYFSQIFPIDSNGIVLYTEGNLGRLQNLGLSLGVQLAPTQWWNLSFQTVINRKKMEGTIGRSLVANITQYSINLANQFRFGSGWNGELNGFYNSRSQQDIQEVVDPAGQLSLGVSRSLWSNRATIKLAVRDIFYTNWMKGLTQFNNATEYFKLSRDSRVGTLQFTWRFGQLYKSSKRSEGAAGDEIQRVGNG